MTTLREQIEKLPKFDGFIEIYHHAQEILELATSKDRLQASNLEKIKSLTEAIDNYLLILWALRVDGDS